LLFVGDKANMKMKNERRGRLLFESLKESFLGAIERKN